MRRRDTAPVSTLPILSLAFIVLTAWAGTALAQSDPLQAEFPAQDHTVWWYMDRGLKTARARHALADRLAAVDTVRLAAAAEDVDGMLRAMRAVVERDPASVADAVDAARGTFHLLSRSTTAEVELRRVADLARAGAPSSPRALAARNAHAVLTLDLLLDRASMDQRRQALRQFAGAWADTEAGTLAEVEAITAASAGAEMLDALDGIVREHPRTPAAARALFQIGFEWHTVNLLGTLEPRDADPTARFFRVLETAAALESGAYPDGEWVRRAPDLVGGFFFPDAAPMSAENATRILDAAEQFVIAHLDPHTGLPVGDTLVYFVTNKMPALHERAGNGAAAGMERSFERLRRAAPSAAAIDYLHGRYVLERLRNEAPGPAARTALVADARHWFGAAAAANRSVPARYALATLAALEFQHTEFAAAQAAYERYVAAYPASPWTWLARLRISQCQQAAGEEQDAVATYRTTARLHASQPMARVLGHAYAGRALEGLGAFRQAASEYRRALAGWDLAYGVTYTSSVRRPITPDDPFVQSSDDGEVIKPVLVRRLARLEQSLRHSGGEELERGRVLLERGRYSDARGVFERLAGSRADGELVRDAQRLAREARLADALLLADRDRTDADERRAIAELEALAQDLHDFAGVGAAIARASQQWLEGRDDEATAAMERAMAAWSHMAPAAGIPASADEELRRDLAEIRGLVFLPRGGPLFERERGQWNAFSFEDATWPFAIVDADMFVRFHDGDAMRVPVTEPLDVQPRVLFVTQTEIETLHAMLTRLGGRKVRVPVAIMDTPNQPAGDSRRILALWTRYFHARGGHWGGWEVEAYPKVTEVAFSDRARTRAVVHVTIGYSGCQVEVEKRDGRWSALRILSYWIT